MLTLTFIDYHNSFQEVEGYKATAKRTYEQTNQKYKLDIALTEKDGDVVYKTTVSVYGKSNKQSKL
jgi:hypothetical protein